MPKPTDKPEVRTFKQASNESGEVKATSNENIESKNQESKTTNESTENKANEQTSPSSNEVPQPNDNPLASVLSEESEKDSSELNLRRPSTKLKPFKFPSPKKEEEK